MIRRIALTLCASVTVLAGAASLPATNSQTASTAASADKTTVDVAAQSARRSGYIVASS